LSFRPKGPNTVFVTGNFDNWSKSVQLTPDATGNFGKTIDFKEFMNFPITYKYVVDGEWMLDTASKSLPDECGYLNNYLEPADLNHENDAPEKDVPFDESTISLANASVKTAVYDPNVDNQDDTSVLLSTYVLFLLLFLIAK
jgi:hypothetical protein